MKQLSLSFAKLSSVYYKRREEFKEALERMKRKRNPDLYQKALILFNSAENQAQELKNEFAVIANGPVSSSVRAKFKAFKKTYKELNEITKPEWRQWVEAILVAMFFAIILRNFIFGLYHVPTGSAEKTILVGDRIWGNKMAYYFDNVKRDDLVIFDNPEFVYDTSPIKLFWQKYVGFPIPLLGLGAGPDNWVKHVIAIPGDTIEGRIEDGKTVVYRNGVKLDEPYVNPYPLIRLRKSVGFLPFDHVGPLSVPTFLRSIEKEVNYTYDPSKPFDDQPFYMISEDEVVRDQEGNLMLAQPYSPTYRVVKNIDYQNIEDIQALLPSSSGDGDNQFVYTIDKFGPITVPDGKYWLMGDNRKGSYDSRSWGFLDESRIHGRASFIIYSIDSEEAFWLFDFIKHPIDFWTKHVRYNRFFTRFK